MECGELPEGPHFHISVLDVFSNITLFKQFCLSLIAPWYYLGKIKAYLSNTNSVLVKPTGENTNSMVAMAKVSNTSSVIAMVLGAIVFYSAIILAACEAALPNLGYVGLSVYFAFVVYGAGIRIEIRQIYGINGNVIEDLFAFLLLYPCATVQLYQQLVNIPSSNQFAGLVSIATVEVGNHGNQSGDEKDVNNGGGENNLAFDETKREQVY